MNKSLLAGVALVALIAGPAFAADMPVKAPVRMPVFDWSGFYIGANVGGSFGKASTDWVVAAASAGSTSGSLDGILGGFQVGYNWQVNSTWVAGLETDFDGTGQKGSSSFIVPSALSLALIDTNTAAVNLPWFGTIRGRFGLIPAEHWLVYITGGAAYGEVTSNITSTVTTAGVPASMAAATSNTVHTGWTVGGGVEAVLLGNWSARLEYLYVDLGLTGGTCAIAQPGASSAACFQGPSTFTPVSTSVHVTDNILRFGIDYRFAPTAVAVAAKY